MRIGVDARVLSHGLMSGIHRYVANILPAMMEIGAAHEFFLYADAKRAFEIETLPPNATLRTLPWSSQISSVRNDQFMRRVMARDHVETAFFPANYGFAPGRARAVVTMHDQINLMPLRDLLRSKGSVHTLRNDLMTIYIRDCQYRSARRARKLVTISEYSKREIGKRLPRLDVSVVRHGVSPAFRLMTRGEALASAPQNGLPSRFVLADALKNPDAVIGAWRRLSGEARPPLLFFSRTDRLLPCVASSVSSDGSVLILRPSDEEMIALFNLAEVFVFPSWLEGFGFPALEAMACGAPVIASSTTALPEVVGEAGLLAEPSDHAAIATLLQSVLSDPDLRQSLRARGLTRAQSFSWERAAAETLRAIESTQ